MLPINELLKQRKSTRKFTAEPLNGSEVELILQAALLSPSSKNRQPWEFVVVENRSMLKQLAECKSNSAKLIENAALAIVVTGDILQSDLWIEDCSIAAILMQIQAEALGIGSCWVQIRERESENGMPAEMIVRDLLELPMQMQVLAIIAFGKSENPDQKRAEKELSWEKVHIEKW